MFVIRRKKFSSYGESELAAMREGKAAGLTGKELREWVSINKSDATKSGNMISLTGQGQKSNTVGEKVTTKVDQAVQNITNEQNKIIDSQKQALERRKNALAVDEKRGFRGGIKKGYKAGYAQGASTGYNVGKNSVGIVGGLKNTWNRAGVLGKAGLVTGGTALAGSALYGVSKLLENKNN